MRNWRIILLVLVVQLTYHVCHGNSAKDFEDGMKVVFKQIEESSSDPTETKELAKIVADNAKKVTKELESIKTADVTKKENKGEAGLDFSASNAKSAVGLAVGSLPTLIDGIQKKDWRNVLKGSLGIAASFLYFTGPWGPVIAAFLPLLDSIFKLMDGSMPKTQESEEQMVDRIVTAAIERAHLKEFKMELAGVQRVYSTLSQSIASFRYGKKELSKEQATALYNLAFQELSAFGKLGELISQKCSLPYDFDPSKPSQDVDDCLSFVDLYSDLSILRKLTLMDMASLLTGKFDETADNLMDMYRREFKTDIELLRFLVDPVDYPASRYITATFYQQRHLHEVTAFFLDILVNAFPHKGASGVLVCKMEALFGMCYEMGEGTRIADGQNRKANDMGGYTSKVMSLFIPSGLQVTANFETDDRGIDKAGPFYGMSVIVSPFKKFLGGLPKEKWQTLKIEKTNKDAIQMVKICLSEQAKASGVCVSVDVGEHDLSNFLGSYIMGYFSSMVIPDGKKVTLYNQDSEKLKTGVGPFYGPDPIEMVQMPQKDDKKGQAPTSANLQLMKWVKIKVEDSTVQENARHMVKICTEFNFKGRCFRVKLGEHKHLMEISPYASVLTKEYSDFAKTFKTASMTIPSDVRVTMYSRPEFEGTMTGPYTGPLQLPYVFQGFSFKIKDVSSEMPSEKLPEKEESDSNKNKKEESVRKEGIEDKSNVTIPEGEVDSESAKLKPMDQLINSEDPSSFIVQANETSSLDNNSTLENEPEADLVKTNKQWDREMRDETFKEFIKDERPRDDSPPLRRSAMKKNNNKNSRQNPAKKTRLGKNSIYLAEPMKSAKGVKKGVVEATEDVFHTEGLNVLKRRNNIKHSTN